MPPTNQIQHARKPNLAKSETTDSFDRPQPIMTSSTGDSNILTTASVNNRNSMYMQDEDNYIAIHHHHFDAQSFLRNMHEKEQIKPVMPKTQVYTNYHSSIDNLMSGSNDSGVFSQNTSGLVIPVNRLVSRSEVVDRMSRQQRRSGWGEVVEANTYTLKNSTMYRSNEHRCKRAESMVDRRAQSNESIYWPSRFGNRTPG